MKLRTGLGPIAAMVLVATTLAIAPAATAAAAPPQITQLETSAPGRVSAKVLTSAPYLFATLDEFYQDWRFITVSAGSATVAFETWGYGREPSLSVLSCEEPSTHSSTCAPVRSQAFAANLPTPQVSLSTDTTLGPGQSIDITVSDPLGEGSLYALWPAGNANNQREQLNPAGVTHFVPGYATETYIRIMRCSDDGKKCANIYPKVEKTYNVRFSPYSETVGTGRDGAIVPINTTSPTTSFRVVARDDKAPSTYSLTWHLRNQKTWQDVPGTGGTASGTLGPDGATAPIVIDGTGLADGAYVVLGTLSVGTADFGPLTDGPLSDGRAFVVDRTPRPAVSQFSATPGTIYPWVGGRYGYVAETRFAVDGKSVDPDQDWVEIRDANGKLVWVSGGVWSGRDFSDRVVPAGTYTGTLTDTAGNPTPGAPAATVVVSGKRIFHETFRRTVTAAASLDSSYVGRCSTLRKPSLRKWKGSLGFYANTRCKTQTGRASSVSTVHAIRLPVASRYGDVEVVAYGGAARSKPGSRAILSYLRTDGKWVDNPAFTGRLGIHKGKLMRTPRTAKNSPFVFSDRYLAWGFLTGFKNRYDVKNFTVTVHYAVVR